MNWHRRLAAFFAVLALVGCVQVVGQGQTLYAPYSHDEQGDTHHGGDGASGNGGGAGGM